ncbi:hypothetical protein HF289_18395 [Acidithiobacillus ferrooxidans]|uniref:hypothetical protein n=1 Tax=Acidithiobacillus ferrooxidans TaxID=920 RepID=UPI001C06736C|nr:hypothetical protein [Acidithiobacillus ferrooxidans]MBU2858743.1 hypothetical protein [Acidithiobacillus ferrooxidans]
MNLRQKNIPAVALWLALQAAPPCIAAPKSLATASASGAVVSAPTVVTSSQVLYTDTQTAILAGESVGRAADILARRGTIGKSRSTPPITEGLGGGEAGRPRSGAMQDKP